MRRATIGIIVAVSIAFVPTTGLARGNLKGTFGAERVKARGLRVACLYNRSLTFFTLAGAAGRAKRQKAVTASGYGPDFSVPGATFPIVLTGPIATFGVGSGTDPSTFPVWTGRDEAVTLTITGYKKGKAIGTLTGSLTPGVLGTGTPIEITATFAVKCTLQ